MINFQNVSKVYANGTIALDNVSFKIQRGEFVCLAGRSGAGKTTLLKLLLAEEAPTKGRVLFEGQDLCKIKRNQLSVLRQKMGAVFQDYKLLAFKTVAENVAFVLEAIGVSDEEIREEVPQVLGLVGLEEKQTNFPHELSAGERQRAAIARALIHKPRVLLADEPTGNLDPYNTDEIVKLLLKINGLGTTVLLATHDKEIIKKIKGRVVVLDRGELVSESDKGEFIL